MYTSGSVVAVRNIINQLEEDLLLNLSPLEGHVTDSIKTYDIYRTDLNLHGNRVCFFLTNSKPEVISYP
jgi:hypothetical protein